MVNTKIFLKNNAFVFSSRIISKLFTFFLMIYLARLLSMELFGELTLLLTLTSIFVLLIDMGTSFIVVKETAAKTFEPEKILNTTLILKFFSGFICFVGFIVIAKLFIHSSYIKNFFFFFASGMLGESFLLTLVKHFEGKEEMKFSSILIISERVLIVIILIAISQFNDLITSYGISYLLSNFLVFFVGFFIIYKRKKFIYSFDSEIAKHILKYSAPFILFNFFSIIYYRLDIFLISNYYNQVQVGIYKASFQIIESIYFISLSLSVSLLPFFARMNKEENSKLYQIYSFVIKEIMILGIFITITLIPNSDQILSILYKNKYVSGNSTFAVLSITIPLYFSSNVMGNLLISIGKEKIQITSMIVSTFFKLLIMIILIKHFGILGAAISAVLSDSVSFLIQYWGTKKNNFHILFYKNDVFKIILLTLYSIAIIVINQLGITIALSILVAILLFSDFIKMIKNNLIINRIQ